MLSIDLGTSALKVVAISRDGRVLAIAREPYPTISAVKGQSEQDPADWLKALSVAAAKIRARLGRSVVGAVALTGQMPTLVVLDKAQPMGRAITWQDSRADVLVRRKVDDLLRHEIYRRTGVLIDGRYLAPMFEFHFGAQPQKTNLVLSAKDFLFHALTGLAITDPSTASGYGLYDLRTNAWDQELAAFWKVPARCLPSLKQSSFQAPLNERGTKLLGCSRGTPVVLGCADSVAGAYAISQGDTDARTITVLTGSSTVILKCDAQPRWDSQDRFLVTPLTAEGTYGREADLLASGSASEWATNVFGYTGRKKSVWPAAYRVEAGADGLFFAPFLAGGEQGILWNPRLRGTISGLTLTHDGRKIVRALLEGMCFEIRRCLDVFDAESPLSVVRLSGWMAEIPQQTQLLADVIGRTVHAFVLSSASAAGAALLSGQVDHRRYEKKTGFEIYSPTERKFRYNELYKQYTERFPDTERRAH